MFASYFPHGATDNVPHKVGPLNFDDLATVMAPGDRAAGIPPGRHMIRPPADKNGSPGWSPCEYREGALRSKSNVIRVYALVIDFDGCTADQLQGAAKRRGLTDPKDVPREDREPFARENMAQLTARLQGLQFIGHTSWSHNTDKKPVAVRVAVKLSRPVEAAEWPKFWRHANTFFGGLLDPATKDASRLFFCAALPAGTDERDHKVFASAGEALDVDKMLGEPEIGHAQDAEILAALGISADGSVGQGKSITLDEVNEFAHEIARSKNPKKSDVGRRLKKMVMGEPFALQGSADPLGGIDNAIFRMCAFLAEKFFDRDPVAVAKMFERSLAEHFKRDGETHDVDNVKTKFERVAEEIRTKRSEADQQALIARGRRIREAFQTDRVQGYTPDELLAYGDMDHKWVIQHGASFYLFFDGDYRSPVGDKAVIPAAARDLAPAHTAGVEVFETDEGSGISRPKTPLSLVLDYGAVAADVVVDLTAQRSYFDGPTRTFVEASCPRRIVEAKYNPLVDEWIKSIGSKELEQWIALATQLDRPCAALYVEGVKGSGKSLLAHGLARLWSTGGPTTAANAIGGTWNDDISRCPLVLADEALPPKVRASGITGEIREFIAASRRPLARRYKPNATMIGAVRMILAANNKNLLETQEILTPNDIAAFAERFLYVKMPQAAASVLARIGRETVEKVFIQEDAIASHALWLMENVKDLPNGRFFFENGGEEIARTLTSQSGVRGSVCTWLVMYLLNPQPIEMQTNGPPQVEIKDGELYVTAQALAQYWASYKTNRMPPSPAQAGNALRGLSHDGVIEVADLTFYRVDSRNLLTWAEETGYCAGEQIRQALAGRSKNKAEPRTLAVLAGGKTP